MKRPSKIKKYILFSLLSVLTVCLLYGCVKKPLDQTPSGVYTTENYWRNQDDALAGVLGIYNVLYTEDWTGHDLYVFDDQSDDISVDGDHPDFRSIESFNIDASLQLLRITWPFAYEQVARANNAIIYIPKIPVMDDAIRNRSLGEAYFLRAHAYFILSQIFGEVPLILEKNVLTAAYNVPKSTVDSVRAQVESDLLKAVSLLPDVIYDDANKGRVSKGAAWGLLCKLYMFEDKFAEAIQYGSNVINDANYALATDYTFNFTSGKQETNTEILFGIWNKDQDISGVPAAATSYYFTPRAWQGWGFHHPTQNFADEFETADTVRKRSTLIAVGDSIPNQPDTLQISDADAASSPLFAGKSGQYTHRMVTSMSTTGYCIRKYTAYKADNGHLDFNLKQPLLRTSDVYLLVAEAKIRLNGAGSGDAEINAVRKRANPLLPAVSGAGMAQLIHERRVELGGENIRWQDLLRWDKDNVINLDTIVGKPKLAATLPAYNNNGSYVELPGRTFTRPKDYYMPIPQAIIDESKGVIKQNQYY